MSGRQALLEKRRWLTFLLPFVVFMLVTSVEPKPESMSYEYYPWIYTAKIVLTLGAVWFVLPGYREFPLTVGALSIVVGVVGVVVWIALCRLDIEDRKSVV